MHSRRIFDLVQKSTHYLRSFPRTSVIQLHAAATAYHKLNAHTAKHKNVCRTSYMPLGQLTTIQCTKAARAGDAGGLSPGETNKATQQPSSLGL